MIKRLISLSTQITQMVNSGFRLQSQCVTCLSLLNGSGLCPDCRHSLPFNTDQCRQCALPLATERSLLCGECLKHPPEFDRVVAPLHYRFPVDRMISRYKYNQNRALGQPLIRELTETLRIRLQDASQCRPELLVPSPMHPAKQRRRGFNQAEDIAEQLSRALDIPWSVTVVQRAGQDKAQSGLNRQQRLSNLRRAFRVHGKAPPRVAIVDDVMTTGATVRALALTLRQAGAQQVEVWVLARTPGRNTAINRSEPARYPLSDGETGGQTR